MRAAAQVGLLLRGVQALRKTLTGCLMNAALLPSSRLTGRRGIAGTVLVHKVAGATAAAGGNLAAVAAAAQAGHCPRVGPKYMVSTGLCHAPLLRGAGLPEDEGLVGLHPGWIAHTWTIAQVCTCYVD